MMSDMYNQKEAANSCFGFRGNRDPPGESAMSGDVNEVYRFGVGGPNLSAEEEGHPEEGSHGGPCCHAR